MAHGACLLREKQAHAHDRHPTDEAAQSAEQQGSCGVRVLQAAGTTERCGGGRSRTDDICGLEGRTVESSAASTRKSTLRRSPSRRKGTKTSSYYSMPQAPLTQACLLRGHKPQLRSSQLRSDYAAVPDFDHLKRSSQDALPQLSVRPFHTPTSPYTHSRCTRRILACVAPLSNQERELALVGRESDAAASDVSPPPSSPIPTVKCVWYALGRAPLHCRWPKLSRFGADLDRAER
jgi:hypothetical protein